MYKIFTKHGQLMAFGLGAVVIVIYYISIMSGLDEFNSLSADDRATTGIFNLGLQATGVLLIICAAAMILFGIYHVITNPKGAIKGIIGVAVLVILFFILYSMAVPETSGIVGNAASDFNLTDVQSKIISAALRSTLIIGALAVLAFVVSEISNFFK